jgi:hypothetical protein
MSIFWICKSVFLEYMRIFSNQNWTMYFKNSCMVLSGWNQASPKNGTVVHREKYSVFYLGMVFNGTPDIHLVG